MVETNNVIAAVLAAAKDRPADRAWVTLIRAGLPDQAVRPDELIKEAEGWARRLAVGGLARSERVVICLDHSLALYASFLGVMMAGGIPSFFAPPSAKQKKEDQEQAFHTLLTQSGSRFLICEDGNLASLARDCVVMTPQGGVDAGGQFTPVNASPDSIAFIQYSSGTTGLKKGIAVTHEMLLSHVEAYARSIELVQGDVICSWLPLYHDMGLITAFFLPLIKGVSLVALSPFDWVRNPTSLLDAIRRHRTTLCWQPNFAYKFLAKVDVKIADLSSMRLWINCSEPVLDDNHMAFLKAYVGVGAKPASLTTCYAMAETVFAVTSSGVTEGARVVADLRTLEAGRLAPGTNEAPHRTLVSSGIAIPGVSIRVLDSAHNLVPDGTIGQIWVKTPTMFSDYLGDVRAEFRDGHFLTGDTGFLLRGHLFVLGREKDIIIVAGRNLYPQDIEAAVDEVPGVIPGRCAAFGVPDLSLGTEALVVLAESRDTEPESLRRVAAEISRRIVAVTGIAPAAVQIKPHMWLKKATSGKISRRLNRERYLEETRESRPEASEMPAVEPAETPVMRVRAAVRSVITRAGKNFSILSDTDSFFELGLIDSLSFIELVAQLEQAFSRRVPTEIIEDAFAHDSIAAIAARYLASGADTSPEQASASTTLVGARQRRQQLSPQFADTDRVRLIPLPYVMQIPQPNFVSPSANTDDLGFRLSFKNGRKISREEFIAMPGKKGIILGNSVSWGTGASHDVNVVHNVLNREMPDCTWFSHALRMSTLTQERIAAELFSPLDVDHVVWVTGGLFILHALTTDDHSKIMPFPSQRQFEKAVGVTYPRQASVDLGVRAVEMKKLLERELVLLRRVFGVRARNIIFAIQPAPLHYDKPLHPRERELLDLFYAMPGPLKDPKMQEYYQLLLARVIEDARVLCSRHGIRFMNVAESPRFQTDDWLFVDPGHLGDAGHVALAQAILDNLS